VDVQLAVDSLQAANRGIVKAIALVSGDSDFVPVARAIREAGPHFIVMAFKRSLSGELANEADLLIRFPDRPIDWQLPSNIA
jgi:uncharacterized protein (TIGR00288 family)